MSKLNDPDFDMFKNWFNDPSTQENFKKIN
jgi:hypothetical protein